MKRLIAAGLFVSMCAVVMAGCGSGSYKDGTYTAQSSMYESLEDDEDEGGEGYGVVSITIKDNKIVGCEFTTYMPDGTVKDEEYGKKDGEIANQDYYNKAQRAVKGSQNYAEQLTEKGDLKEVDAITGATISYNEFNEAVELALKQAKG
ncbi:MAG: FMN-binding protein [Eubacterium sp.]|nr:FMN-binding protein [Eubacterium sp.]